VLAVNRWAAASVPLYFSITGVAGASGDRVEVAPEYDPGVLAVRELAYASVVFMETIVKRRAGDRILEFLSPRPE
jgi:hypothetical protein